MTARTYARVYHEIVDDPKFSRVYGNDGALGTWLRMLLVADAMYPSSAPLPRSNSSVRLLIDVGLVEERPGRRYIIHGLEGEREHRSEIGRNAADKRWHSDSNASAMPSRAEQSRTKQSSSANAPSTNGTGRDTFMGWGGRGLHDGRHGESCGVCHPGLAAAPPSKKVAP